MNSSATNNKEEFYHKFFSQKPDKSKFKYLGKPDTNDRNRFLCDNIKLRTRPQA